MDWIVQFGETLQRGTFGWVLVAVILTLFELLNPHQRLSLKQRSSGMAFWAFSIPVTALLATAFTAGMAALEIPPLMELPVFATLAWAGPLASILALLIGAVINDLFFYAFHRIQHRWLWRYHAVHHSIRDLSAVNSYHHISESWIGLALFTLPTTLIVSDVGPALPFASLLLWLHIVWIHSPTRFNFGPLRAVFVDNRYHRIHHSLEHRHFDHNFGAFTTIWDRLFGTHYAPQRDEWPDVGLAEVDQPRNLSEWLDLPARYSRAVADDAPGRAESVDSPVRDWTGERAGA
ncbi:sterol desaturase family protein [Sphingomonas sp. ST-64]|uniref:Sterol desaturase family protein n=1 Tax=Sphingomonas plantiphila TaxID=3163295 RepID=A0ABW8YPR8_9SPHN